MSKHILVALPLGDDLQARLKAAVPSFTYRFTTQETATLEEILWADASIGPYKATSPTPVNHAAMQTPAGERCSPLQDVYIDL